MGLRYLFIEWRRVFPRNPMAKYFAIALMFGLILIHVFFGIRYSLLAWPSSADTRQTYMLK
jgi:succinate dehydrogenase/fumarate reductase cytochrome b subunit